MKGTDSIGNAHGIACLKREKSLLLVFFPHEPDSGTCRADALAFLCCLWLRYETECGLRQNVDADICNLRPVLDQLASCKTDLQLQCEALTEEMCCLKTNHEEVRSLPALPEARGKKPRPR